MLQALTDCTPFLNSDNPRLGMAAISTARKLVSQVGDVNCKHSDRRGYYSTNCMGRTKAFDHHRSRFYLSSAYTKIIVLENFRQCGLITYRRLGTPKEQQFPFHHSWSKAQHVFYIELCRRKKKLKLDFNVVTLTKSGQTATERRRNKAPNGYLSLWRPTCRLLHGLQPSVLSVAAH